MFRAVILLSLCVDSFPESVLLGAAALGGSLGALLGMYLCHHKTRKPKFFIAVPLLLAVQAVLLCLWYRSP